MIKPLFDFESIRPHLTGQSLILSSNRRLSNQISAAYDQHQIINQLESWPALPVYPLDEWLSDCWRKLSLAPNSPAQNLMSLSTEQESLLWQEIVANDSDSVLIKAQATAKTLQSSYRILQLWDAGRMADSAANLSTCSFLKPPFTKLFYDHPDCACFIRWARQFEKICLQRHFISTASTLKYLSQAFDNDLIDKAENIILVGFQHLPPGQAQLLEKAAGSVIDLSDFDSNTHADADLSKAKHVTVKSYPDSDHELLAAALWVKEKVESEPNQRIGIIVPDLAQRRAQVERIFTSVLEPQYLLPATAHHQLPFNISAGMPFSEQPLVNAALTLLALNQQDNEVEDLYMLLDSPFTIFDPVNSDASCQLQLAIREKGWPKLAVEQIQNLLQKLMRKSGSDDYASLLAAFKGFEGLAKALPAKKQPLTSWVQLFSSQLSAFGWPGQRRLNSMEYQQIKRWQQALQNFIKLQAITGDVGLSTALLLFQRHINSIEFQAESSQTPIHLLGMLEGGGLAFDALRLVGLNDHRWPESAKPNPFIPIKLQIDHNMPHSSAARELYFSRQLLNTYLNNSSELIASYAQQEQDTPLRPSALIPDYLTEPEHLVVTQRQHPYYLPVHASAQLETLADNLAPPVDPEVEPIHGGSQVLKHQAACPFKAFAIQRLNARDLDTCSHHLTPQHRGIALHRSLEYLWRELQDFQSLLAQESTELEQLVKNAIAHGLKPLARDRADLFMPTFNILESERLQHILKQWLQQESFRAPFKVKAIEAGLAVTLAGLPLQLRIDRIDQLEDGSLMIIDYKSGSSNVTQWQGDRLDDPQLPLYAITFCQTSEDSGQVKALAFAQINVENQRFVGLSADQDVAPGVFPPGRIRTWQGPQDWPEILADWRTVLTSLAGEFAQGKADVSPKNAGTCRYCHLQPLCRIDEQRLREGAR
jgi:probable DNA repair protein